MAQATKKRTQRLSTSGIAVDDQDFLGCADHVKAIGSTRDATEKSVILALFILKSRTSYRMTTLNAYSTCNFLRSHPALSFKVIVSIPSHSCSHDTPAVAGFSGRSCHAFLKGGRLQIIEPALVP
jgi:hypothetical protein